MGLKSWRKEFYPVTANWISDSDARTVIAHSLQKWVGLLPENLKKHNVVLRYGYIVCNRSGPVSQLALNIDSSSCSLCGKYYSAGLINNCYLCPLYKVRGNVPCFRTKRSEIEDPYTLGTTCDPDPRPMIHWLQKTLAAEKKKQAKRKRR